MGALTVIAIVLLDPPFLPGLLAIFGVAYLMVSQVEYPKPQGLLATATLGWIVVSIGCLAAWAAGLPGGDVLMHIGAFAQIALAAMAPLLVIRRKVGQKVGDVRPAARSPAAAEPPVASPRAPERSRSGALGVSPL